MSGTDSPPPPTARSGGGGLPRRTVTTFLADGMTDTAAALTYYSVLSIFPGLLVLASLLGILGEQVTRPLLGNLTNTAPAPVRSILTGTLDQLIAAPQLAGAMAIVGLGGAVWAASGYVGAFMRAANMVYKVTETRPLWKTLAVRLGVTLTVGFLLAVAALLVVFTGRLAAAVGELLGASPRTVAIWGLLKWPLLVLLVAAALTVLFWACPNIRDVTVVQLAPGGLLAVALWLVASAGFAIYVANFASYDKTYGTLGGVIVFLVWLWISNLAILFGVEFNAARWTGSDTKDDR